MLMHAFLKVFSDKYIAVCNKQSMCWRLRQRGTYVCMNLYRPPCALCSHNQYRPYSFEMPLRESFVNALQASGMPCRRASSRLSEHSS